MQPKASFANPPYKILQHDLVEAEQDRLKAWQRNRALREAARAVLEAWERFSAWMPEDMPFQKMTGPLRRLREAVGDERNTSRE